jgi:hypothetical protein
VSWGEELPEVVVEGGDEKLMAVVKFVIEGLPEELFVELLELLLPKWDPARKGLPLGEGFESDEEEEEEYWLEEESDSEGEEEEE